MISLSQDCLLFELGSGESIPFSSEMITIELMGDAATPFDPELVQHAAASVFHYFRNDLARESVTVGEFTEALEKALRGLGFYVSTTETETTRTAGADLRMLARESGAARELVFFPRLRNELRSLLQTSPRLVRFRGLRGCVKHLAGARRWSPRCESLRDQIIGYLRECLSTETRESKAREPEYRLLVE